MKYIIDTSVLITAWKITYPKETFSTLWDWFESRIICGDFIICNSVYKEIKECNDDLLLWLTNILTDNSIKAESDGATEVIESYGKVINEANRNQNYSASALTNFASNADGWVIAHALAYNYVLVTEEKSNIASKKNVKIPDICACLGVRVINSIGLFKSFSLKI